MLICVSEVHHPQKGFGFQKAIQRKKISKKKKLMQIRHKIMHKIFQILNENKGRKKGLKEINCIKGY